MRYLCTIPVLFCLLSFKANAGDGGGCGTVVPTNYQFHSTAQERAMGLAISSRAGVRYVPVTYHIVTKTNGTGGISLRRVFETHCMLNIGFQEPQMYFYIYSIDTVQDDALWAMSDGQGGTNFNLSDGAYRTYNIDNVVNVYITGALPQLCGFANFPISAARGGGLFLNNDCCGLNQQTIPHEMGHFFNLLHTFQQTFPVEYVDGSNCATKGDGFCDTPADPSESRASCPYNLGETDPHGDTYDPEEDLFMSYFNDGCLSKFSPQQQTEMNQTLSAERSGLLTGTPPDVTPLDTVTFISPSAAISNPLGSSITFKWTSVPRAQYYLFRLQLSQSSIVLIDTLLTDTIFNSGGLQANKNYKYSVRPISYGNVCESQSPFNYVQTSLIKATFNVVTPSCAGQNDATIGVTPSNGVPPYTVSWSNSQTGTTITNLAPGTYDVTITDNNGKEATATVQVTDPAPVTATVNIVGSNLNAYGNGGTPPYSYTWSNGSSGQYNNNVPFGTYTVTVTDSKGCTSTQTLVLTSAGVDINTQVSIRVFPNPASKANALNLQLSLNERTNAQVSLININGEVVQQFSKEFAEGTTNTAVNISEVAGGIYFIQFRSAEVVKTERISIIR